MFKKTINKFAGENGTTEQEAEVKGPRAKDRRRDIEYLQLQLHGL